MVKDVAGVLPGVFYSTVILPSILRSIQLQSSADQYRSGQDFYAVQIGDVLSDFSDADGNTIWDSKPLNASANGGSGEGIDINSDARAAFTTQGSSIQALIQGMDLELGFPGGFIDDVADRGCGFWARVGGIGVGVVVTGIGLVGGTVTGGTTTAGTIARLGTQAGIFGAISLALAKITGDFVTANTHGQVADACGVEFVDGDDDSDINVINSPQFISCVVYAKRMEANISSAPMGGVPVGQNDETVLLREASLREQDEFKRKSLAERLFSPSEERSLLMAVTRPSSNYGDISQGNLSSLATNLLRAPASIASNLSSVFDGRAYAQEITYDWGFPIHSMPLSMLDDPELADPVANADWVVENRDSLNDNKIEKCFGVKIVNGPEGIQTELLENEINPLSDEYNNANCGANLDKNENDYDETWARTVMFVTDDGIARSMDCYDEGESAACGELGISGQASAAAPPPLDTPGLNGYTVPCTGQPRQVVRINAGGAPRADWTNIPSSGIIGTGSDGSPINVYIREACDSTNVKTVLIASSIHGSENGGQLVAHELLFNEALPPNIRLIVIPEINKFGINLRSAQGYGGRVNANGINLNRNFDYRWEVANRGDNYNDSGPFANSEPEAQALVSFLDSLGRIDLGLHYHDNISWVAAVGNSTPLTLAQTYASHTPDTPLRSAEGGRVYQRGSLDAWHNETSGTPSLLIEMSDDQSSPIISGHVRAVKALMESGL